MESFASYKCFFSWAQVFLLAILDLRLYRPRPGDLAEKFGLKNK